MVSGCTCSVGGYEHFRIGTGFDFVMKSVQSASGLVSCISGYCGELGAYYGTYNFYNMRANNTAPGGVVNLKSASGNGIGTSTTWGSGNISIVECNFCEVSSTVSGSGSVTIGGTKYNEKYRKAGSSVAFTASPASGYKVKKVLMNGSAVDMSSYTSGDFTYTVSNIQQDYVCVAYFVPTQYQVTCNAPSGGTVAFTKNGNAATVPFYAEVDDVIVCTATPNVDKMVQNFVVDGYVTAGGSTGAQAFTFTIYEREDDATYNCSVSFADRTSIICTVVGKSDGTTDDATVTTGTSTVTRGSDGTFNAYVGNTYTATAVVPSEKSTPDPFREFAGWKNANAEVVSAEKSYSWTQGNSAVSITAAYVDNSIYAENFYVGTSTSDYGTDGTAYVAGCRATISRTPSDSKVVSGVTKYLGGSRTVTATTTPSNWTFSGVYVSDTDASGGTKFYKANGASSVTFESACNANIYAIFANGEEVAPSDVDQGDSMIATGTAAGGLYEWEGGASNLTMRYHSKRFVASMPMTLSTGRVYADGYATNGTNDVKMKVLTFQSPDTTDSRVVETTAKSQDAYRLPMRRPEKYIELEVSAPHQVTQVAVATGMEALWQA